METNILAKAIVATIKSDGKAAIPYIGCFKATTHPATLSDDGTQIAPPKVELTLDSTDREISSNITRQFAKLSNSTFEEAEKSIEEIAGNLKRSLIEQGTVYIEQVGQVSLSKEGEIGFTMAEKSEVYDQFFGLEPISVKPKACFANSPTEDQKSSPTQKEKKTTKVQTIVVSIAIAIVVIALLIFVFYQQLSPLLDKLLYSKEELELMQQLNL